MVKSSHFDSFLSSIKQNRKQRFHVKRGYFNISSQDLLQNRSCMLTFRQNLAVIKGTVIHYIYKKLPNSSVTKCTIVII